MNGKKIMTTLGILLLTGLGYFKGMGFYSQSKTPDIGLDLKGNLTLCGEKPNCVSSLNTDESHKINPIDNSLEIGQLVDSIKDFGIELQTLKDNYAHFTAKSAIMGFVDDIEILKVGNIVHVKSISRVGHSDLGANRKRIEAIRLHLKNNSANWALHNPK